MKHPFNINDAIRIVGQKESICKRAAALMAINDIIQEDYHGRMTYGYEQAAIKLLMELRNTCERILQDEIR